MDAFTEAFYQVDTDEDEVIHMKDLEAYVKKNKLDEQMITKWKSLFDNNNDGVITLTEFCDTLGLQLAQVRMQRVDTQRASAPKSLQSDVKIVHTTMSMEDQIIVTNEVYRIVKKGEIKQTDMADEIKKFLDQRYGRMWQVVITRSGLWSSHSHTPTTSVLFTLYEYNYLIWRTPE